jgi:hypothetical protein
MRILSVSFSLLALAVCAGCAQQPRTTELGAGPAAAPRVYCRDGAWVSSTSACGSHGGVERDMSSPSPK